jgi:hypothetical protein
LERLLKFIRQHEEDVSKSLFLMAGFVGIFSQSLHPALFPRTHEMIKLAHNIAEHGVFSNPFFALDTGPTAVNPPLYPFLLAVFMKLLRSPTLVYQAAVVGCVLANAVTAALLPRISLAWFGDVVPGVFASLLWLSAMPIIPSWDVSYTVVGILAFCLLTSAALQEGKATAKSALWGGTVAGLVFLLNPASLLVLLPWPAFLLWQAKTSFAGRVRYCCIVLGMLCIFIAGWGGRNYYQLGGFALKTNLGMTLYSSNNDCAKSSMFRNYLSGCFQTHHPNESVEEAQYLRRVGEIEYDRERTADTKTWIHRNPRRFALLTLKRIREFWFPAIKSIPPELNHGEALPDWVRLWIAGQGHTAYAVWIITALSVPGLFLMARRRELLTAFVLMVFAIYPLLYYVVVSDVRYRYPILWLSLLAAGYFLRNVASGFGTADVNGCTTNRSNQGVSVGGK